MFYDKYAIDSNLICPICEKKFDDPRNLPCGETVCVKCTTKMCALCGDEHIAPIKGFPISKRISNLLAVTPLHVSRGALFDQVTSLIDNLDSNLTELNDYIKNSENRVNTHCEIISTEIEVYFDSLKEDLDKNKDQLLKKVESFRTECQENKVSKFSEIKKYVQSGLEFKDQIKCELSENFNVSDSYLKEIQKNAVELEKNHDYFKSIVKYEEFHGKLINVSTDGLASIDVLIPKITFKHISKHLDIKRLEETNECKASFEIGDDHKEDFTLKTKYINTLDDMRVLVAFYFVSDKDYNDELTELIVYRLDIEKNEFNKETQIQIKGYVFTNTTNLNKIYTIKSTIETSFFEIYSDKLEKLFSTDLSYIPEDFCISSNSIYVLDYERIIHKYDFNLNKINCFGQKIDEEKPFYMRRYERISYSCNKLILQELKECTTFLTIFNEESGMILGEISVDMVNYDIKADLLGRIYITDTECSFTLQIYDICHDTNEFKLILEKELSEDNHMDSFCITSDGYLAGMGLNDDEATVIYIF